MGSAWLDTTTVYGPAFTAASEPLAVAAGDSDAVAAWSYKALAAAAALAAALLAGRLARRRAFAIALVGWNPILAVHLAGGGHNDALGRRVDPGRARALGVTPRTRPAGSLWVLAIAVKWVPVALPRAARARVAGDRPAARRPRARRRGSRRSRSARRCSTGGAWPLAIFPLVGNAALETSYAIPHRLEQLGAAGRPSRSRSRRGARGRPRLARARARLAGAPGSASPPASCS